jgi:hypothetical protein
MNTTFTCQICGTQIVYDPTDITNIENIIRRNQCHKLTFQTPGYGSNIDKYYNKNYVNMCDICMCKRLRKLKIK